MIARISITTLYQTGLPSASFRYWACPVPIFANGTGLDLFHEFDTLKIVMKRLFFLLLLLLIISTPSFAQEIEDNESKILEINEKIVKIEAEIIRLDEKLLMTDSKGKEIQLQGIIDSHKKRIERLRTELSALDKEETPEEIPEISLEVSPEVKEEIIPEKEPRIKFEIGGLAGLFAGSTSFIGELRYDLKSVYGAATTTLRLAGGFSQSEDMTRRYAPVFIDLILNYPPGIFSGVNNYIGLGLNYTVLTSGQVAGSIGGELFYGVESEGFGGKLFGEMGYGVLDTGFGPQSKGITLLIGFRRDWAIY
jgi:hypothetical protein